MREREEGGCECVKERERGGRMRESVCKRESVVMEDESVQERGERVCERRERV